MAHGAGDRVDAFEKLVAVPTPGLARSHRLVVGATPHTCTALELGFAEIVGELRDGPAEADLAPPMFGHIAIPDGPAEQRLFDRKLALSTIETALDALEDQASRRNRASSSASCRERASR
jgi:hypothetical protein